MKMDWLRTSIIGGILVITFLLIIRWNEFQERNLNAVSLQPTSTATTTESSQQTVASSGEFDVASPPSSNTEHETVKASSVETIQVLTDTFLVSINPVGGDIVKVALPKFNAQLVKKGEHSDPFVLLEQTPQHTYIATSGLVGPNGTDSNSGRPKFVSASTEYNLGDKDQLHVDLLFQQPGAQITKRFTFNRNSYLITVEYIVKNQSQEPWQAGFVGSIKRDNYNPVIAPGLGMQPFLGAATTTNDKNYDKYSFEDIDDEKVEHSRTGGWVAMIQHYFMSAWIPSSNTQNAYSLSKMNGNNLYLFKFSSAPTVVAPGETGSVQAQFYAGPKDVSELEKISPHLDLTVDYGFLWMIAKPLFWSLDKIHSFVGNWGVAIVLLTLCIKIIFFYPSAISYRSMAKMRKVQPKMAALKETYGDDRQRMSQELMKLYKTEKVNPVSGCLPMLIQMPVFIALYWALMESVELRHASFLWMHDLSIKDPFFILPLVMGLTMWIQQHLNPTPPDPMQAKLMQWMPVFFTGLFMFFPAGLVVYWVVNNTLSIIQQYIITKQIENQK